MIARRSTARGRVRVERQALAAGVALGKNSSKAIGVDDEAQRILGQHKRGRAARRRTSVIRAKSRSFVVTLALLTGSCTDPTSVDTPATFRPQASRSSIQAADLLESPSSFAAALREADNRNEVVLLSQV